MLPLCHVFWVCTISIKELKFSGLNFSSSDSVHSFRFLLIPGLGIKHCQTFIKHIYSVSFGKMVCCKKHLTFFLWF